MQSAVEPAIVRRFHTRSPGVHEILCIKMRARTIRTASGVHDCQMALLPNRLKRRERGLQAEEAADTKHRASRDGDGTAHRAIGLLTLYYDNSKATGCAA